MQVRPFFHCYDRLVPINFHKAFMMMLLAQSGPKGSRGTHKASLRVLHSCWSPSSLRLRRAYFSFFPHCPSPGNLRPPYSAPLLGPPSSWKWAGFCDVYLTILSCNGTFFRVRNFERLVLNPNLPLKKWSVDVMKVTAQSNIIKYS